MSGSTGPSNLNPKRKIGSAPISILSKIGGVIILAIVAAFAAFVYYLLPKYETTTHLLAVKQVDGRVEKLMCNRLAKEQPELIWGLMRGSLTFEFYIQYEDGARSKFANNELVDPLRGQFASIPGTANWVGAYDDHVATLVVFLFDGSGKILSLEKLEIPLVDNIKDKAKLFKIVEKDTSIIYMARDGNGYMKYNYVDKTKSRYEGILE